MNIEAVIHDDWAEEPRIMAACLQLWGTLSGRPSQLDHYTFADLTEMAKEPDRALLTRAVFYLATPRTEVLKTCLMYEFRGLFLELPEEEVDHYSRGQSVIHPEFGEPIPESEIMICFTPGNALHSQGSQ
jgi:hypothetical protein